jgi:hypothetical protein
MAEKPTEKQAKKGYDPRQIEPDIYRFWIDGGYYHAEPDAPGRPYCIVIPPPNVTDRLHIGHGLNNTIQDILIRWRRMAGDNAVWIPGTDHAGIATQTVVEKRVLAEEGRKRTDFTREEFVAKIQAWKDEYERTILDQLKAMGCSCDWDRTRFTMDPVCARAVREAFFRLFKDGLIYRGKRLVNWDPATQTALADDEVEMEEIDGHFWYLRYPLVEPVEYQGRRIEHVTVATTRPETMLGDTAVAMNPVDPRVAALKGRMVRLPIVNRIVPIITDEYVVLPDPDSDDVKAKYATGFLKVTPAHDQNDYDIGRRHNLPLVNILAPDGTVSEKYGWPVDDWKAADPFLATVLGKDRFEAREMVVGFFKEYGLLEAGQTLPPQRGPQLPQPCADRAIFERSVVREGDRRSPRRPGPPRPGEGSARRVGVALMECGGRNAAFFGCHWRLARQCFGCHARVFCGRAFESPRLTVFGRHRQLACQCLGRPTPLHAGAIRPHLSGLAREPSRLVHQSAALVGAPDTRVDRSFPPDRKATRRRWFGLRYGPGFEARMPYARRTAAHRCSDARRSCNWRRVYSGMCRARASRDRAKT